MKLKLCILSLVGLVAWSFAASAQDTPPAAELQSTNASVSTTNDAAPAQAATADAATAPNAPAVANTAAADDANATNAPASAAPAAEAASTNAPPTAPPADAAAQPATPVADAAAATATTVTDTNAPALGGTIPLIVMDDVPLTDAIKNLARQAGINYMLDPRVAFGQIGPDGKPVPQPTVSIRWENVTAEQALTALLGNYNLQLVEDPKSKIARVTVKDPAAPDPLVTKIIQLKYATPTNIMVAVENTLTSKGRKVVADIRTSQL